MRVSRNKGFDFLYVPLRSQFYGVPRVFAPAKGCTWCGRPNDFDFRFCQACGRTPPSVGPVVATRSEVDVAEAQRLADHIARRRIELRALHQSRDYTAAVDAEVMRLIAFLRLLDPPKAIESTLPRDVVDFYLAREVSGASRTQFHVAECIFWGQAVVQSKPQPCGCRMGVPPTTFSTNWGKLSKHFRTVLGRVDDWNPLTSTGNPCLSDEVKQHAEDLKLEAARAGVQKRKATPIFSDKLGAVVQSLFLRALKLGVTSVLGYALIQDATFLVLLWGTSTRGGNLDKIPAKRVFFLPEKAGVLIDLAEHKTMQAVGAKRMVAMRQPNVWLDPVTRLEAFMAVRSKASAAGILPPSPYLFRKFTSSALTAEPFEVKTLNARLESYLVALGLFATGERVHGLRAAERIETVLTDGNYARALANNDWESTGVAEGYLGLCETISLIWAKDPSFQNLTHAAKLDYFRALSSKSLTAVAS